MKQVYPFETEPRLPIVPPPFQGEALGGWAQAVAQGVGLPLLPYLRHLGVPLRTLPEHVDLDIVIRPLPAVLDALHADTGIAYADLRNMTFAGLIPEVEAACLLHDAPCEACTAAAAEAAGRPIELLSARSAWRVICPEHPPAPKPDELSATVDHREIDAIARKVIGVLDRTVRDTSSFAREVGTRGANAFTAGTFIRFVHMLNGYIKVKAVGFDDLPERLIFSIADIWGINDKIAIPPEQRNTMTLSIAFAWQLVIDPITTVLVHLRSQEPGGEMLKFILFTRLLLDIWPSEYLQLAIRSGDIHLIDTDVVATRLAAQLTKRFNNRSDYKAILEEASTNHLAFARAIFPKDWRREFYSFLPPIGPFTRRSVAANWKQADLVEMQSAELWAARAKTLRAGLGRFGKKRRRKLKKPIGPPPIIGKYDPSKTKPAIVEAVRRAMEEFGPLPAHKSLKARRKLLRELTQSAGCHYRFGHLRRSAAEKR